MPFDFVAFRRLLCLDALDDAVHFLRQQAPAEYETVAARISGQLSSWRRSLRLNPFGRSRRSRHHVAILRNLYRAGLAASKNEPPPKLAAVHPLRRMVWMYSVYALIAAASFYAIRHTPQCPVKEKGKDVFVIIDKFATVNQPFFHKIGLNKETAEFQIYNRLNQDRIGVKIHPLGVRNEEQAIDKCRACNANMVIYGKIAYGNPITAYLHHFLDGESYNFATATEYAAAQEKYSDIFGIGESDWIGSIHEMVLLFKGLLAKNNIHEAAPENIPAAFMQFDSIFGELAEMTTNDSLKVFALHCLAWSEVKQEKTTEALDTWNRILEIDPGNMLALHNSGFRYLQTGSAYLANQRFDSILVKEDIPYVTLANVEALTRINDTIRADKELKRFKRSAEYKERPEIYTKKVNEIPKYKPAAFAAGASVSSVAPAAVVLNEAAVRLNAGNTRGTLQSLEALNVQLEKDALSPEEIQLMSELYLKAGETDKAETLRARAGEKKAATLQAQRLRADISRRGN